MPRRSYTMKMVEDRGGCFLGGIVKWLVIVIIVIVVLQALL